MSVLVWKINGVDITELVQADLCILEEAAEEGQIGTGTWVVRDIAGIQPLYNQTAQVYEDGVLIYNGTVGIWSRGRDDIVDHIGGRRLYRITVLDRNHMFDERRADDFNRPVEDDIDRLFEAFDRFRPTIDVSTYVSTVGVEMDAADYRDRMLRDIVGDVSESGDKNYWIDRNDKLHYHSETNAAASNASSLVLTDVVGSYAANILASPTPTTYNIGLIERQDDPNALPVANDILLKYGPNLDQTVNVTDATSISAYGLIEGPVVSDDRASSLANATHRANVVLSRSKDPEVSYNTTIALPKMTLLKAGQFITCTSTHAGLSASALRVATMRYKRVGSNHQGYWMVELDLGRARRAFPRGRGHAKLPGDGASGTGGGDGTNCGCPPVDIDEDCPSYTFDDMNRTNGSAWGNASGSGNPTWAGVKVSDASPGSLSVFVDSMVPTHGIMKLTHPSGPWNASGEERISGLNQPWTEMTSWKLTTSVDVRNANAKGWSVSVGEATVGWGRTLSAGAPHLQVLMNATSSVYPLAEAVFDGSGFVDIEIRRNGSTATAIVGGVQLSATTTNPMGSDDDLVFAMYGLADVAGGAEVWFGPINFAECSGDPNLGQEFHYGATGDGSTTVYTSRFPYRSILRVVVAGVDVTDDVVATSPSTGVITFGHAPPLGATIRFYLEGA